MVKTKHVFLTMDEYNIWIIPNLNAFESAINLTFDLLTKPKDSQVYHIFVSLFIPINTLISYCETHCIGPV